MSDKAARILKTAEALFAAGRYHEVTLDEVCEKARVGKGTIYRYFKDKEDLYYKVILTGMDELAASIGSVAEQGLDPRSGLREAVRSVARFFNDRAALFALMHSEQLRGSCRRKALWRQMHQKNAAIVEALAAFIRRGVRQGDYQGHFKPKAAARLLMAMVRTGLRNQDRMPGGRRWPDRIVDLFENGLLVRDEQQKRSS